jgi:hypothetical protein
MSVTNFYDATLFVSFPGVLTILLDKTNSLNLSHISLANFYDATLFVPFPGVLTISLVRM